MASSFTMKARRTLSPRAEDDAVGFGQIGVGVIDLVGDVRLLGEDLGEAAAFLELEVFDLVVVGVHAFVDPELAPVVIDHAGLFVQDGYADVHILCCHFLFLLIC